MSGVRPGRLATGGLAVAEPGRPLRAVAHLLAGRLFPQRHCRRSDEYRLEHLGAAARAGVPAGVAHGAEGALRPLLPEPGRRAPVRQSGQHQ